MINVKKKINNLIKTNIYLQDFNIVTSSKKGNILTA